MMKIDSPSIVVPGTNAWPIGLEPILPQAPGGPRSSFLIPDNSLLMGGSGEEFTPYETTQILESLEDFGQGRFKVFSNTQRLFEYLDGDE